MILRKLTLAALALAAFAVNPTAAQSPPFNAYSISTLGGNCAATTSIPYQTNAATTCTAAGTEGQALTLVGGVPQWTSLAGTGSVTSVGLTLPSIFSVTGSPITASGTLAASLVSQSANSVFAAPNGSAGVPSFRQLTVADITNALGTADIGVTIPAFDDRRFDESLVAQSGHTMPPETGWLQRYLHITGDDLDAQSVNPIARGLRIAHEVGGATLTGGRIAQETSIIHTAEDSPTNATKEFVALTGSAYGFAPGAFGGAPGTPLGALYGGNSIVTTINGYTDTANITAHEFNTQMETGSSTQYKSGIQIASRDEVFASGPDMGVSVSAISGAVGYKQAIGFGDQNGGKPIPDTGVILGGYSRLGGDLIGGGFADFLKWDFQQFIMRFKKFVVSATGSITMGDGSSQVQIDGVTSANGNDFDARLAFSGGAPGNGNGVATIVAALIAMEGKMEVANVPATPTLNDHYTISMDASGAYLRWRDASGDDFVMTLGTWTPAP